MAVIINNTGTRNFFTVEHTDDAPYTEAQMDVEYTWDEGLRQVAVAEAPGTGGQRTACEILRENAPVGGLTIHWVAKRDGAMPYVPDPRTSNENLVFSGMRFRGRNPRLTPPGMKRIYRLSGTYFYFFRRPVFVPTDGAWMGWVPYDSIAPQLNVLQASAFRRVF